MTRQQFLPISLWSDVIDKLQHRYLFQNLKTTDILDSGLDMS